MREFSEENLTEAVVERFANTPDPRLKLLVTSLVRHLHACVREVEPTFDEWMAAINFLTRTGQTCTDKRQEFILLSDTLAISMLVDAINHRNREGVTETTVLGPFYVENPPDMALGSDVTGGLKGDPLYAEGTVCAPAPHGRQRPVLFLVGDADVLSDPLRWAGRRSAEGDQSS